MTPPLWCSPHVHVAKVDDDVLVLDVLNDRYHCLLNAADSLGIGKKGALAPTDAGIRAELQAVGFAEATPPASERLDPILPQRELALSPKPPRLEVINAALAWGVASVIFRGKPLSALIRYHHALSRSRTGDADEARLADIVGAARKVRPWIPFEGACLQRSFQLRCHLATRGVATDWVFGVRTWPFSAHCWLQIGDLVVGDRLTRVLRYTPILRA